MRQESKPAVEPSRSTAKDTERQRYEPPKVISVQPLEEVTLFSCVFDPDVGDIVCQ